MRYFILTTENICDYLKTLPQFEHYTNDASLRVIEFGDGNLNSIFRIATDSESMILKQALPYLRCAGPEYLLSEERIRYEIAYMHLAANIVPTHIPKIYYADESIMRVVCMQDLKKHVVMREGVIQGIRYSLFSQQIAYFLAETTFKNSYLFLSFEKQAELIKKFNGNGLCQLTANFVFTFPYQEHETNYKKEKPDFSNRFRQHAMDLRTLFLTHTETLIHGDLHTGSIMLNQEEMVVIDGEFAFVGPIGFDVGLLIANLITAWIFHDIKKNSDYQAWLMQIIENIMTKFTTYFFCLWQPEQNSVLSNTEFQEFKMTYLHRVFQEAMGFAGLEICRRICGIAGVKEIRDLQDRAEKKVAETMALLIGKFLVEHYVQLNSIQDVCAYMKNIAHEKTLLESTQSE